MGVDSQDVESGESTCVWYNIACIMVLIIQKCYDIVVLRSTTAMVLCTIYLNE